MTAMDTSTATPNEAFFIRTFSSQKDEEPKLTSAILRKEEWEEFSMRWTSPFDEYDYHIRDFKTVCRGEKLVSQHLSLFNQIPSRSFLSTKEGKVARVDKAVLKKVKTSTDNFFTLQ